MFCVILLCEESFQLVYISINFFFSKCFDNIYVPVIQSEILH